MARVFGAKAIAEILESIWGIPVSDWAVYHMIRDRSNPLPVKSLRKPGARKGKLYAESSEIEQYAKSVTILKVASA